MALVQGQKCALYLVSNCLPYLKTTGQPTPQPRLPVVVGETQVVTQAYCKQRIKIPSFYTFHAAGTYCKIILKIWGVRSSSLPTLPSTMSSMTVKISNSHRTRRTLHFINVGPLDDPMWLPTIGRNLHSQSSGYIHSENKANSPPEQLVTTHQTTRCHFSEQHDLNLRHRMNLKFQIKISSLPNCCDYLLYALLFISWGQ